MTQITVMRKLSAPHHFQSAAHRAEKCRLINSGIEVESGIPVHGVALRDCDEVRGCLASNFDKGKGETSLFQFHSIAVHLTPLEVECLPENASLP